MAMAKADAPFCYVPPVNIFAWVLMPLRYAMPRRQYVALNHAVVRVTHFPLLFGIYFYERFILSHNVYELTDLIDRPRRARRYVLTDPATRSTFFSPSIRVREASVVAFERDRALDEVFRRIPHTRNQRRNDTRKSQTAIRTWMEQQEPSPRNYSTIDSRNLGSDWHRRLSMNRERPSRVPRLYSDIRSTASDPADLISDAPYSAGPAMYEFDEGVMRRDYAAEPKDHTDADADGDDELVTNDEDEGDDVTNTLEQGETTEEAVEDEYFTPVATRFSDPPVESPRPPTSRRVPIHTRTMSTNTILYAPESTQPDDSSASDWAAANALSRALGNRHTPVVTPITPGAGRRSPRRHMYLASNRPRSMIQPGESLYRTMSNRSGGLTLDIAAATHSSSASTSRPIRRHSLADLITSTSAYHDPNPPMTSGSADDVNRTLLAKMQSLEESLGFMVREMRNMRRSMPDRREMGGYHSDETTGRPSSWTRTIPQHNPPHHPQPHHHHYHQYHQWQQQQQQRHQNRRAGGGGGFSVGSDPSSTRGQMLIETAVSHVRERERDREKGEKGSGSAAAGPSWLRRARLGVAGAAGSGSSGAGLVTRRSLPPRRPLGVWRSSTAPGGGAGPGAVAEDKNNPPPPSGSGGGVEPGLGITGISAGSGGGSGKGKGREKGGSRRSSAESPLSGGRGRGGARAVVEEGRGSLETRTGLVGMSMSPNTDELATAGGKGPMSL
jgi:hypothetical protein